MKKLLTFFLLGALLLSACGGAPRYDVSSQTWEELPPEGAEAGDSVRPIVIMNSMVDPSLFFRVKYHPDFWEIKETKGRYRTAIIFNHKEYDDETCYVLPGTVGFELDKEYSITEWQFQSTITYGIDYEFANPVTFVPEMRVFEAGSAGEGFPTTLFELHLPLDGSDLTKCREDYEQLIGTFQFEYYSGTPEELEAKLVEIEMRQAEQQKLLEQQKLQEFLEDIESAETTEETEAL